ncbi:MAG: ferredoxin-thioredoxin reductase catalytic domain-containing protein [Candidatus Hodarchaeaceae archaeon]|nr:ferredoxin-thioredoxin reductase catalytic domain-containing protein [Candidatus Hodarchaeaceae archaeon]
MNAKQLKEFMRRYAESQGFQLNPDEKTVGSVIRGLLYNEEKFGRRYCPCRAITGDPEQDRPIICPCAYHKDELERMGHCLCGLFVKS